MSALTVKYNDKCNFCLNIKKLIEKLDTEKQISFEKSNNEELTAISNDGKIYISEEVVAAISEFLPGIKKFSWMFRSKMGKKTNKLFYEGIKKIRDLHNKCSRC